MLRNVLLVARRDFLAVVRTKGFVIGLVFLPAMITVSSQIPKLFERFSEEGVRRFAVADFTGRLSQPLAEKVAARNAEPGRKVTVALETVDLAAGGASASDFAAARGRLVEELSRRARLEESDPRQLYGFVVIGPKVLDVPKDEKEHAPFDPNDDEEPRSDAAADPSRGGDAIQYGARSLTAGDVKEVVRDSLREAVRTMRLEAAGLDAALVRRIDVRPRFGEWVIGRKEGDLNASSGRNEALAPMFTVILMLMGVMQSAGMLLNSLIEEKSNRVVEVLVSSIRPFDLLAGKILGAWLVGLTMLLAWGGAAYVVADQNHLVRPGMFVGPNILWFTYFFVAGYLLFASLYAAVGAMCTSIQDAQSFMFPIIVLIMVPMLSLGPVLQHPDSVLSQILTYLPFSAPFIATLRLTLSPPAPQWQIAIAAVSVAAGAWLLMWMGGKVFRIAIFMSGKPPKPSEIWRWVREA
jgi:ABC-2 type transport system permease protein